MAKREVDNFLANLRALCAGYGAVTSLAQHLGVHRVTMSRIVNGHDDDLSLAQAEAIAKFYSRDLSELLVAPSQFRKTLAAS